MKFQLEISPWDENVTIFLWDGILFHEWYIQSLMNKYMEWSFWSSKMMPWVTISTLESHWWKVIWFMFLLQAYLHLGKRKTESDYILTKNIWNSLGKEITHSIFSQPNNYPLWIAIPFDLKLDKCFSIWNGIKETQVLR